MFQVFTPTSPASLNYVQRPSVNDEVANALRTPGKQLIVYGESGSGKSTLLGKKLNEHYKGHVTVSCTAASTFESIIMEAFDLLDPFFESARAHEDSKSSGVDLGADFWAVKASIKKEVASSVSSQQSRALPPQLTAQRLADFMGQKELCWVLEDFHKVPVSEKKLIAQTFKVFSDMSARHSSVRIVAIGATDTAREVVQYDPEMRNRVAEIHVPLMSHSELQEILANGQRLMNVQFLGIYQPVVDFSAGLASVCHHLALNACLAAGVEVSSSTEIVLGEKDLKAAIAQYIGESSDTLKAIFDAAMKRERVRKYDNGRLILTALADAGEMGLSHGDISAVIRLKYPEYPGGNITQYFNKLLAEPDSIVRKSPDGRYRFAEAVYRSYAQMLLGSPKKSPFAALMSTLMFDLIKSWDSSHLLKPSGATSYSLDDFQLKDD